MLNQKHTNRRARYLWFGSRAAPLRLCPARAGRAENPGQVIFLKPLATQLDSSEEIQPQTRGRRFLFKYANLEETREFYSPLSQIDLAWAPLLSNFSPKGGQQAGENRGGGESNTSKSNESRGVPQSEPAKRPTCKHRTRFTLCHYSGCCYCTKVPTLPWKAHFWTSEPQRQARGEGRERKTG